jgi:uncharacterized protein (DUF885 family)
VTSRPSLLPMLTAAACLGLAPAPAADAPVDFRKLLADVAAFSEKPLLLPVPPGVDSRYSKRLEDVSEERFQKDERALAGFAERLRGIDRQGLGRAQALDAAILDRQLRDRLEELRFRSFEMPIGSREGFHFAMATEADRHAFDRVEQYDEYVAKLQSFREHTGQQIVLMRKGLASGRTLPREVLLGYEQTIAPQVVDEAELSELAWPFVRIPGSFPEADRERLRRDGLAAIRDSAVPGFRDFLHFMRSEYIPGARATLGVTALPDGAAFYRHRIRMHTTLDLTPDQVHEMGLREVARLRLAMQAVARRAGFTGTLPEFFEFLRSEPRFYARTPEDYLRAVALWAKRMDGALPRLFGRLPRTPYGIRAMPPRVAPRMSAGYYDHGEADGSQAGYVNVNTSDLPARPLYVAPVLAFHEGAPGHHLQIMLAREDEQLSNFRRKLGITAFSEGWGLYAEQLGADAGLAEDPYEEFGRLAYEIWRAVRLVVDTGVHAFGWSRQQAIDYLAENTGFQPGPAAAEVDRHITEAGQGLAYTPGMLKIRELRRRAEERLGRAFDLRAFHDAVLRNGPLPLDLMQQEVEVWLEETVSAKPSAPDSKSPAR